MNTPLALHPVTGAIGAEIVGSDVAGLLHPARWRITPLRSRPPCIAITSFLCATRPWIAPAKSG